MTSEIDRPPLEGVILRLETTTYDDGRAVTTWTCPVCSGTVRAHTSDPDKAREFIAKYAPHRTCAEVTPGE